MHTRTPQVIDTPDIYHAGREPLSLALIDARNHTLHLLALLQEATGSARLVPAGMADTADTAAMAATAVMSTLSRDEITEPPLWLAGHIAWFSEWWIGRNTQRALGAQGPERPARVPALEPQADAWWNPQLIAPAARWSQALPDLDVTRAYLLETLESSLDMLEKADETDAGLYFYRVALLHEDLRGEQLVVLAQTLGLRLPTEPMPGALRLDLGPTPAQREALLLPATEWTLGAAPTDGAAAAGFALPQESGSLRVAVPEFEIDAQPITWQQFAEFVDDSGYDRPELWQPEGWRWLSNQADMARRAPRHIEQISLARQGAGGGAVLQRRFGRMVRVAGQQSAVHLSWWEADAWARWAGRRLATEVEWEIAAHNAAHRGFRWGDVHEWTAGTLRPWPGFQATPWSIGSVFDPRPAFGEARVLRGASFATRSRLASPKRRSFAWPGTDAGFYGARTCAL